jgi:hypothetical protein
VPAYRILFTAAQFRDTAAQFRVSCSRIPPAPEQFIAMELLEGKSLDQQIGGQPVKNATLLKYGIQIADALDAAHTAAASSIATSSRRISS